MMLEWVLCGLMLACAGSLAVLVWMSRRAITRTPDPINPAPGRRVAVIIPVTGSNKTIESSIDSLLSQAYPSFEVVIVTRDPEDPAIEMIRRATQNRNGVRCIHAGPATLCGQKNHNLLAGVDAVAGRADVLVFADSGHEFPAGWLARLVAPLALGQADVASGYHAVRPAAGGLVRWVYAVCVEMMYVFQNTPGLNQPWGGGMAISSETFERLKVSDTWRISVVDDVSLARLLRTHRARVRTVPLVCCETTATGMHFRDLFEWLVRQLQYIRFVFPGTWAIVGLWSALQILAFCSAAVLPLASLLNFTSAESAVAAALYLALLALIFLQIRLLHPLPRPRVRWLAAGALFMLVFGMALAAAGVRREIQWRGISYRVARGGRVLAMRQVNG